VAGYDALPAARSVEPGEVGPLKICIVPVAVPAPGATAVTTAVTTLPAEVRTVVVLALAIVSVPLTKVKV